MRRMRRFALVIHQSNFIRFYIPLYWIDQLGIGGEFRYDLVQAGDMLEMIIKKDGKYKIVVENRNKVLQYGVYLHKEFMNLFDSEIVFFEKTERGLRMYFVNSEKYVKQHREDFEAKRELHEDVMRALGGRFKLADIEECAKKLRVKYNIQVSSVKRIIYALASVICEKLE